MWHLRKWLIHVYQKPVKWCNFLILTSIYAVFETCQKTSWTSKADRYMYLYKFSALSKVYMPWENGSQFLKLCIQRTSTSSGLKAPLIYFFYCILNTFLWLWSPYDDSTILSFLVSTHINLRLHHIWYIILAKRLKLFISGGKFFFGCFNITSVIFSFVLLSLPFCFILDWQSLKCATFIKLHSSQSQKH